MRAEQRWSALDSSGGNREKTKCSKLPVIPSSVGVSILQSLPPGHRGNRPGRGPSSLRPSTCKDGHPQSQHWQIQHCDFLKQTERKRLGAVFIAHTTSGGQTLKSSKSRLWLNICLLSRCNALKRILVQSGYNKTFLFWFRRKRARPTPGGCGHIDGCFGVVVSVVETPEKLCAHLQSPCATQTLDSPHLTGHRQLVVMQTGWKHSAVAAPTLFSWTAGLSSPSAILDAEDLNSGRPRMGRYSWFSLSSCTMIFSTFFTTGRTHGWLSSVR